MALASEGLSRLNGEAGVGGSAAPSHIPGDLPPGTRGAEGYLTDGGFKIGIRGGPLSLMGGGRPRVILGGLFHILIIKSKIETMAPERLLIK